MTDNQMNITPALEVAANVEAKLLTEEGRTELLKGLENASNSKLKHLSIAACIAVDDYIKATRIELPPEFTSRYQELRRAITESAIAEHEATAEDCFIMGLYGNVEVQLCLIKRYSDMIQVHLSERVISLQERFYAERPN